MYNNYKFSAAWRLMNWFERILFILSNIMSSYISMLVIGGLAAYANNYFGFGPVVYPISVSAIIFISQSISYSLLTVIRTDTGYLRDRITVMAAIAVCVLFLSLLISGSGYWDVKFTTVGIDVIKPIEVIKGKRAIVLLGENTVLTSTDLNVSDMKFPAICREHWINQFKFEFVSDFYICESDSSYSTKPIQK